MNQYFSLSLRNTYCYASGWDSLDEWEPIGEWRSLSYRTSPPDDERGFYWTRRVQVRSADSHKRIVRALYHTLRGSNCRHEHDCCGCPFWVIHEVKQVAKREYIVKGALGYNV